MRAIDIIPLTGVRAHPRQDYRLRLVTGREQGAGSKRTLRQPGRRRLGPRPWALPPAPSLLDGLASAAHAITLPYGRQRPPRNVGTESCQAHLPAGGALQAT